MGLVAGVVLVGLVAGTVGTAEVGLVAGTVVGVVGGLCGGGGALFLRLFVVFSLWNENFK